jgi:hypothetical protein
LPKRSTWQSKWPTRSTPHIRIVAQPIDGGAPKQLTHYNSGRIFWFDISRDGQLALARGSQSSDVVLIRNFQ